MEISSESDAYLLRKTNKIIELRQILFIFKIDITFKVKL